jgi:hypothetical protein
MSDPGTPPPPGWQPPAAPPPGYQAPPPGYPTAPPPPPPPGWAPYPTTPYPVAQPVRPMPGMLGAAHKPGAMPLRPLGLGDIYDAAFRIIRFNPKATVGSAVLVAAVAMAIPVVVTAILTATLDLTIVGDDSFDGSGVDGSSIAGVLGSFGSLLLGAVLSGFGTLLVTGMIAHVTGAAAVGRRLSLGEAWAATRGKRWRLVGLSLLLGLISALAVALYVALWLVVVVASNESLVPILVWGLVSVPAFLCLMVWFWVRVYYLPVPALMLEPVGVFSAIGRAFALTRRQFWRTFGIALLTLLLVGVAGNVIGFPVGLVGQLVAVASGPQYALLVIVVTQAVSQVVTAAFVTPFTAAVTSLQYLDQRMRKEAYDVELMQQAGITGS